MKDEYALVAKQGLRPKVAIERSIEQHARICAENSVDYFDAAELVILLDKDIEYRVKKFSYCICKSTDNYVKWLQDDYKRKLSLCLNQKFSSSNEEE
jgi:hypothetical protein